MTKKSQKATAAIALILVAAGGCLWFTVTYRGPLDQPVLDGKPIGYWLEKMAIDENNDRHTIRNRLVSLGPPVIPPLLAALEDRPSALKQKITTPFLLNHFPKVADWLWRRRPTASWMAADVLAEMPADPRIRDGFVRSLRRAKDSNEDSNIGFSAATGLGARYTTDWAIVVPALRAALQVPHDNIQAQAALALPNFGTNGLGALPDLIGLLDGTNRGYLRAHVTTVLGSFGPAASNAIPAIRPLLMNREPQVRRHAAVAIWRIAPSSEFPTSVFLESMKCDSVQERVLAAGELARLNPAHAEAAVGVLAEVIHAPPQITSGETNHWFRWRSAGILGEIGAAAKAALPTLIQAETNDSSEVMRREAKSAREKIEASLKNSRL